jgi:hypothetical protein
LIVWALKSGNRESGIGNRRSTLENERAGHQPILHYIHQVESDTKAAKKTVKRAIQDLESMIGSRENSNRGKPLKSDA